jgi:hypothetical protein
MSVLASILRGVAILTVIAACSGLGQAAEPTDPCPLTELVRGADQAPAAYAEAARAASEHHDSRCRAEAQAAMALVDRFAMDACIALARIDLGPATTGGSAARALEAELAWRCGRPRRAHRAALSALDVDRENLLARTVLARTLEARMRTEAARESFARALARAPEAIEPLRGMARLAEDRGARQGYLERYLAAAPRGREPWERRRSVMELITLNEVLAGRELWRLEKLELPSRIELRGIYDRPGSVSAWLLRCDIGGRERVPTLLDSGASGLHLADRTAERTKLEPLAVGTLLGGGGEGRHSVERGIVSRLDFGPLSFEEALGVAARGDLHPRGAYRALVGMDLFSGLRLVLDPGARELWLLEPDSIEPGAADPEKLDPWPRSHRKAPILRVAGQLLVPVTVRDAEGRHAHEGLALIDTGAETSMVSPGLADAIGGVDRSWRRRLRGYGGRLEVRGAFSRLTIELAGESMPLRDVPVVADLGLRGQLAGAAVVAVVGMDAVGGSRMVLDLLDGWITLSPLG